jgi:CheY-like chemotaxis protein
MNTILIADDDGDVRQVLRRCLRDVPCTIFEAADGLEAWDMLQAHQPRLVILDIRIPGRNGLELTRALKADPLLASTWVLVVAGDIHAQAAVQQAGADDFLSKPFAPDALRARVRRGLGLD